MVPCWATQGTFRNKVRGDSSLCRPPRQPPSARHPKAVHRIDVKFPHRPRTRAQQTPLRPDDKCRTADGCPLSEANRSTGRGNDLLLENRNSRGLVRGFFAPNRAPLPFTVMRSPQMSVDRFFHQAPGCFSIKSSSFAGLPFPSRFGLCLVHTNVSTERDE